MPVPAPTRSLSITRIGRSPTIPVMRLLPAIRRFGRMTAIRHTITTTSVFSATLGIDTSTVGPFAPQKHRCIARVPARFTRPPPLGNHADPPPVMTIPSIHRRVPLAHLLGLFTRLFYPNRGALPDSRAPAGGLLPFPPAFHQLRPEWKDAALGWFRRMNQAAVGAQVPAQGVARHAQAHVVFRAVDVLAFK